MAVRVMSADWKDVTGKGGAYLIERAQAVQKSGGTLSPVALQLVQEEAERLKYILEEELFRLHPAGDLTPEAITALRGLFAARIVAAQQVLAVSRGAQARAAVPGQPGTEPAPGTAVAAVQVPPPLAPAMFACSRVAGWSAHILEQKREARLIRPSAQYVGPGPRPLDSV